MKILGEKNGNSEKALDKISKEEMNLAEYPFTLLSGTPPKGVTKIEYTDWITKDGKQKQLRWVVSGSEEHGLPVGGDQDVYVAIMEVWREQGFKEKTIRIGSTYQILKKIRLPTNKQNYNRFKQALDRLTSIYITTENAFWNKEGNRFLEKRGFHLFDGYEYAEERKQNEETPSSSVVNVTVSGELYESVQNGYLKDTNLTFYLSLSSALPKRIYRYLDKKKYLATTFSMELFKFANKMGIMAGKAGKYYPSPLKQILNPAFDELVEKKFLKSYEYRSTSDSLNEKIMFVLTEPSQTANVLVYESDDNYWIKPFLQDIITITEAEHSTAWYTRTLRIIGQDESRNLIYRALSLTKEAMHLGEIRTSKDQYFISTAKRLCQERGFEV